MLSNTFSSNRRGHGRGTPGRVHGRGLGSQRRLDIPGYVGGRGHTSHRRAAVQTPPSSSPTQQQVQVAQTEEINVRRHAQDVIWGSITILTAADILFVGLTFVNFGKERQENVNVKENTARFIDHYGVPPQTVVPFFCDLKGKYPEIRYKEALMTMHWFKTYNTERQLSGVWEFGCLKYIRDTVKDYARKMASMEQDKVIFGGFDEREVYIFSLDDVHFLTEEFRLDPSSKWYDFKSNSTGLKYEFAMAIRRPAIVWRRGPFPCSTHDITIFRGGKADTDMENRDRDALYFKMEELGNDKKGVGDSGFAGEPGKIVTTNECNSKKFKEFMARVKNRQESLFIRMKSFNILGNRFRHGKSTENKMELHGVVVGAITVIVQYDFENGRPPFQVC